MTRPPQPNPRRSFDLLVATAYLVIATYFVWSWFDEEGVPFALGLGVIGAFLIIMFDVGLRLIRRRKTS